MTKGTNKVAVNSEQDSCSLLSKNRPGTILRHDGRSRRLRRRNSIYFPEAYRRDFREKYRQSAKNQQILAKGMVPRRDAATSRLKSWSQGTCKRYRSRNLFAIANVPASFVSKAI